MAAAGAASTAVAAATRKVLVTGANKGIGRALVKKILETGGPDVSVLLGSRDATRGQRAVDELLEEVPGAAGRLALIQVDVSSPDSVARCAEQVAAQHTPLYALVNNAGIGFGRTIEETLNTNTFGPIRCCSALLPHLDPEQGRIVNISSASGPMFVANQSQQDQDFFAYQDVSMDELEAKIQTYLDPDQDQSISYGLSKALLNVFTRRLAKDHPNLRINACTPGFIDTDITAGMGASNPPEMGTGAPMFLLFNDELEGNGQYYGSDAVRSPLDTYRGPGDPAYTGP